MRVAHGSKGIPFFRQNETGTWWNGELSDIWDDLRTMTIRSCKLTHWSATDQPLISGSYRILTARLWGRSFFERERCGGLLSSEVSPGGLLVRPRKYMKILFTNIFKSVSIDTQSRIDIWKLSKSMKIHKISCADMTLYVFYSLCAYMYEHVSVGWEAIPFWHAHDYRALWGTV